MKLDKQLRGFAKQNSKLSNEQIATKFVQKYGAKIKEK